MAIAPLPPDYLTSPTAGGAITSAAARLFAEEGRRIAQSIEETSLKNEAQAKAPALAAAYATGLSKLSQGDMSGFELLTKAEGESVGNPFLMQMTRSATSEGARMANSYIQNQRQTTAATNIMDRQSEMQRAQFDRQASDDYRTQVQTIDKEYAEAQAKWEKSEAGRRRQAEIEGVPFTPTTPPEKPAYPEPPRPTSKAFGGSLPSPRGDAAATDMPSGGGDFDTGLMPGDTPMPGTPATAQSVRNLAPEAANNKNAADIYGKIAAGENAMTGRLQQGDSLVNEAMQTSGPVQSSIEGPAQEPRVSLTSTTAPSEGIQLGVTRKPEQRGNDVVIPLGRMNWHVAVDPKNKLKISETVNTETGSKTYTTQATGDDKVDKFIENVGKIESMDYDLAQWVSAQIMQGKKVSMEPIPGGDKNSAWIAKSNGEPFGMDNPEQKKNPTDKSIPATIARPISEDVGKLWNEASGILPQIKDKVRYDFPPTKDDVEKDKQEALRAISSGEDTIKSVNAKRKKFGLKEVSEDEVKKFSASQPDETAKKLGIKSPQELGEDVDVKDRKKYAEKKIDAIDRQISSAKKKYAKNPTNELFEDLKSLQRTKDQWSKYL